MLIDKLSLLGEISKSKFETLLSDSSIAITGREALLLMLLRDKPRGIAPKDIADAMNVTRGSITRHIISMLDKGLVQKTVGDEGRSYHVMPTKQGHEAILFIDQQKEILNQELGNKLSKEELTTLFVLLDKLID